MEGHPSAGFDVSITVEDVDEVVQSLSKQISIQLGNTRTQNVDFALAVNPREQHVLVQAWRVISQRIGRNILQWRNNIGRYSLYFTAQRTVWPMQLDTFEAYAQGRATTTACIPEDAKSTGGGTDLSILQTMNLQWNTRRATELHEMLTELVTEVVLHRHRHRPLAEQDIRMPDYGYVLRSVSDQVFQTLFAPMGYSSLKYVGNGWRLAHPQGIIKQTGCVVQ
jgi:hypothetical protein